MLIELYIQIIGLPDELMFFNSFGTDIIAFRMDLKLRYLSD